LADAWNATSCVLGILLDGGVARRAGELDDAMMDFDTDGPGRDFLVMVELGEDFLLNLDIVFHGLVSVKLMVAVCGANACIGIGVARGQM